MEMYRALLTDNNLEKDSLDVNGVLSPGKMGIWPKRFRDQKWNVEKNRSEARL